uniref:Uncharacterized protein n=1 Tax=Nelumbo nucifera TaxID=4432 RepID=A0A822Z401_NELNU|nr:TPA_asm: hypothetical protein HUJ06_015408 [Nelumbo nucifera]
MTENDDKEMLRAIATTIGSALPENDKEKWGFD